MKRHFRRLSRKNYIVALVAVCIVALIGFILLTTRAAGTNASLEPEDGTINAPASKITDSAASGGKALKFSSGQTTPPPPPGPYNATILADQPVAFWAMSSTGATEPDLTGNDNTGTYKGGTPPLATMPNGDKAVDFNGTSQYMTVPSKASLSIPTTHQLTWESWIRPDTLQFPQSSDGYIDWMGKCFEYGNTCEWEARMYNTTNSENRCNRISGYVFNPAAGLGSAADWQPTCGLIQANKWLHVVAEYQTLTTPSGCNTAQPGSIDIWVNGVKWSFASHKPTGCMSQYKIIPVANNSPFIVGSMAFDYWFKGSVGKVAIYDKLLTQAQINAHFTSMSNVQPSGSCADSCTIGTNNL